jgi:predicted RNase H-like HicB family nuclease
MNKNLSIMAEKLASRPYIIEVILDETTEGKPIYLAKAPELEGCFGQGESVDDAVKSLGEARVDYIYSLLEDNLPVPDPNLVVTTTAGLTSTLTLHYRQSDTVDPSETKDVNREFEKPLRLYRGSIRV